MDDREKENEGETKPTGKHLRKLEQGYMKEAQPLLQLINSAHFCYNKDMPTNNDNEKKLTLFEA